MLTNSLRQATREACFTNQVQSARSMLFRVSFAIEAAQDIRTKAES